MEFDFIVCSSFVSTFLTFPSFLFSVGTFGVWFTGVVLDTTQNDWSYVFTMIASINVLGGLAFLLLFDSKREFE